MAGIAHKLPRKGFRGAGRIRLADPTADPAWDRGLADYADASFFHSSAWARVLRDAYGYLPCYFCRGEGRHADVIVPAFEVASFLTGMRGVSLPFSDFCDPLCNDAEGCDDILESMVEFGRCRGWRYVEVRSARCVPSGTPASTHFVGHELVLTDRDSDVFARLRSPVRTAIRKAEEGGVQVDIRNDAEAIRSFYRLHGSTRARLGIPPQPMRFFRSLHSEAIAKGLGVVALATYRGQPIAAAIFLRFGKRAIYKFSASDRRQQHLRANNLVMWRGIQWCIGQGIDALSFGRTSPGNRGLLQFKRGWGAEERELAYYRYAVASDSFQPAKKHVDGIGVRRIRHVPQMISRVGGALLYRHMG